MKLYLILFATSCVLSMCKALECNWKTQYEYTGKCCDICPSGEFPSQHCKDSSQSVCKKCEGMSEHCFCKKDLCENDKCTTCSLSPRCKPEEELKRTGLFQFEYICIPSLNQTHKDEVDKMDKPKQENSDWQVTLAGNRTHSATCDCQVYSGMAVCLAIINLVCLLMLICLCKKQKTNTKYSLTSSSPKALSDEYVCKLSKEEKGEV